MEILGAYTGKTYRIPERLCGRSGHSDGSSMYGHLPKKHRREAHHGRICPVAVDGELPSLTAWYKAQVPSVGAVHEVAADAEEEEVPVIVVEDAGKAASPSR